MIVVDANVLVYRLVNGPRTPDVILLVQHDAMWSAPLLWRSEVRNALAMHMRAEQITQRDAESALLIGESCLLGGERRVSDQAVFNLIARSKCSSYDCEYVALAETLGTILVTEDQALLKAFPQRCRSIKQVI